MERAYRPNEPRAESKPETAAGSEVNKSELKLVKGSVAKEPQARSQGGGEGGGRGGREKKSVPQRLARLELDVAILPTRLEDTLATFNEHKIQFDAGRYNDLMKDLKLFQEKTENLHERMKKESFVIDEGFLDGLEREKALIERQVEGFEEDAEAVSRIVISKEPARVIHEEEEPVEAKIVDYSEYAQVAEEGSAITEVRQAWDRLKNMDKLVSGLLIRLNKLLDGVESENELPDKVKFVSRMEKTRDALGDVRGELEDLSNKSLQSPISLDDVRLLEIKLSGPISQIKELEHEVGAIIAGTGQEQRYSLDKDDPRYVTGGEEETPVSTAPAYTGGMAAGGASAELSEAQAYDAIDLDFFDRGEAEAREARDEGKLRKQWEGEEVGEGEMHRWLALAQTQFVVIDGIRKDIGELKQKGVDVEDFGQKLVSLEHKTGDLLTLISRHKSGQDQLQIHTPWEELNKSVDALKAAVEKKLGKNVAQEIGHGIGTGEAPSEGQGKGGGGGGGGFFGRVGKWTRAAVLAAAGLVGFKTADVIIDHYGQQPAPHSQRVADVNEDKEKTAVGDKSGKVEAGPEVVEEELIVSSVKLNKGDTILEALDKSGLKKDQIENIKNILQRKYRPSNRQEGVYKILNLAFVGESIEWQIDKRGKVLDAFWLDGHGHVVEKAEREKRIDGEWKKADNKKSAVAKPTSQHGTRPAPASGRVAGGTLDGKEVQLPGGYAGRDLTSYSQDLRLLAVNIEPGTSSRIEREDGSMLVVSRDSKGNFEVRIDPDPAKLGVAELGRKVFGEGFEKALSEFSKLPGRRTMGEDDLVFKENMRAEMGKYLSEYYPYMLLDEELEKADVGHANNLRKYVRAMMNHLRSLIGISEKYYKENQIA